MGKNMGMAKLGSKYLIHEEAIRNIHPKQNVTTLHHQIAASDQQNDHQNSTEPFHQQTLLKILTAKSEDELIILVIT